MANLSLSKTRAAVNREESETFPFTLTMEPWNGDVTLNLYPKTRQLVMVAIEKAKQNPKSRRHKEVIDGENVVVEGDPDAAFVDEMADLLIHSWRGVEDEPGVPAECNRENKILLFQHVTVANRCIDEAGKFADSVVQKAKGN